MNIKLPELHPGQKRVANSPARFKIIVAGRRWGKTFVAAWIALRAALSGKNVFWIGPTYQTAERGWRVLKRLVRPLPANFVEIRVADREINFSNGGRISAKSGDKPDNLRGEGVDLAVFDEAAYLNPYVWYEVIRPALADTKGHAVFISTPKGRNWYYDLFKLANESMKQGGNWEVFEFASVDNPNVDPKEIEEACKELTPLQCEQEFGGKFIEMSGDIFVEDSFHYYEQIPHPEGGELWRVNGDLLQPELGQRIMTVDLALTKKQTSDFSCFCAGVITPNGIGCITDVYKFKAEGPDLPFEIKTYMQVHRISIAYVESTAFQLSVVQSLVRMGITVEPLKADGDKVARAKYASIRMGNKQMLFPQHALWLEEVKSNMGNFPNVEHDDDVDAVSYFAVASTRIAGDPGMIQTMSLDEAHDLDELYGGVGQIVSDYDTTGLRLLQMRGKRF